MRQLLRQTLRSYSASEIEDLARPIINRIVEIVKPVKIILFGSAVSNHFDDVSDLEFVVILKQKSEVKDALLKLYRLRADFDRSIDFLCVDEERFAKRNFLSSVLQVAYDEGRVVYEV